MCDFKQTVEGNVPTNLYNDPTQTRISSKSLKRSNRKPICSRKRSVVDSRQLDSRLNGLSVPIMICRNVVTQGYNYTSNETRCRMETTNRNISANSSSHIDPVLEDKLFKEMVFSNDKKSNLKSKSKQKLKNTLKRKSVRNKTKKHNSF